MEGSEGVKQQVRLRPRIDLRFDEGRGAKALFRLNKDNNPTCDDIRKCSLVVMTSLAP